MGLQAKAMAMEAIRLAMQQKPVTDVGSDPNLVAQNAVREAMVSASGGFMAGHQAENVGDPSNHDRKVQAIACDMLQTVMDRLSRLQTPASVALEADIQALSHRGTPKTSSSRQTADDVEPGIRFQRGQRFWQASSATEVRSRSESRGQARPAEANVSERSRRPSSETPSGDFVLRQTDRWPGADAHETPAASPVLGASSVWSPVSGSSASDSMSPPGTAPLRPRVLPGREIGPYIESREASDAELFSWWSEKTTPIGVGGEMESVVDMEVIGFQRGDVSAKPPLAPSCHPPARRPQRGKASEQKGPMGTICCSGLNIGS